MSSQLWKLWHASGARTSACARGIPCTVVSCPSCTYAHGTLHSFTGFEDSNAHLKSHLISDGIYVALFC